jgi:branched-chain amino acid aminotransferase
MNISYLNGKKVIDRNIISLYNPSFLYGVNVFEGIRAYNNLGKNKISLFDLDEHLERLYMSARFLSFNVPLNSEKLKIELLRIIALENVQEDVYIRITFFIGEETTWSEENNIHYLISLRSMPSKLEENLGISLAFSSFRRISSVSMPPSIKSGANYLNSRYALIETRRKGFDGALFMSSQNYISESTGSCIFFIKGDVVYTPSRDCDILVGITRNRIINLCLDEGFEVFESRISPPFIYECDAAFLAGTMIEIKPINKIEGMSYDTVNNLVYKQVKNIIKKYIYEMES